MGLPPWCVAPLKGHDGVQKLDARWFVMLGVRLGAVAELPDGTTLTSGFGVAREAIVALRALANAATEVPLPKCRGMALGIVDLLERTSARLSARSPMPIWR
jgi:hypothetical protein